jgi:hypothetical protein
VDDGAERDVVASKEGAEENGTTRKDGGCGAAVLRRLMIALRIAPGPCFG